jgi:hypothetical protein
MHLRAHLAVFKATPVAEAVSTVANTHWHQDAAGECDVLRAGAGSCRSVVSDPIFKL